MTLKKAGHGWASWQALWLYLLSEWDRPLLPFKAAGSRSLWLFIGHWDLSVCLCGAAVYVCEKERARRNGTKSKCSCAHLRVTLCLSYQSGQSSMFLRATAT